MKSLNPRLDKDPSHTNLSFTGPGQAETLMKSEVAALIKSKYLFQNPGHAEILMKKGKAAFKVVSTFGYLLLSGYLLIAAPSAERERLVVTEGWHWPSSSWYEWHPLTPSPTCGCSVVACVSNVRTCCPFV